MTSDRTDSANAQAQPGGAGEYTLEESTLEIAGRTWSVLHSGMVVTQQQEQDLLRSDTFGLPYGVAMWPSCIALSCDLGGREAELRGRTVLELGPGTGLPGMVAASLGARVVQVDRFELVLDVCRTNCERNGVTGVEQRLADWTDWHDEARYDWIVGADILYGESLHPYIIAILARNLRPGGRALIADPMRATSVGLLERLDAGGWDIDVTAYQLGVEAGDRTVAVCELTPPGA